MCHAYGFMRGTARWSRRRSRGHDGAAEEVADGRSNLRRISGDSWPAAYRRKAPSRSSVRLRGDADASRRLDAGSG